jgi:hypothetical protein
MVFGVLKSVAIGSGGISGTGFSMEAEADGPIDNISEQLSTLSPSQSPMSSPSKMSNIAEGSQQRTPNIKSNDSNAETEANIRSVRLAAKMVRFKKLKIKFKLIINWYCIKPLLHTTGYGPFINSCWAFSNGYWCF